MNPADIIRIKDLLPTAMGSDELREQVAADILRRSVFSARMESARYLARVRDVCAEFADGGMNLADARMRLTQTLSAMGHDTAHTHGITDPASIKRINLVVETQAETAAANRAVMAARTKTRRGRADFMDGQLPLSMRMFLR